MILRLLLKKEIYQIILVKYLVHQVVVLMVISLEDMLSLSNQQYHELIMRMTLLKQR